jgi:hypothetical protein
MGPIYRLAFEANKILLENLEKMIQEGNICPSTSSVGTPIQLRPKPLGK